MCATGGGAPIDVCKIPAPPAPFAPAPFPNMVQCSAASGESGKVKFCNRPALTKERFIVADNLDGKLTANIDASLGLNEDGKVSVIVMNTTDKEMPFHLWVAGKAAETKSAAHSIMTFVF